MFGIDGVIAGVIILSIVVGIKALITYHNHNHGNNTNEDEDAPVQVAAGVGTITVESVTVEQDGVKTTIHNMTINNSDTVNREVPEVPAQSNNFSVSRTLDGVDPATSSLWSVLKGGYKLCAHFYEKCKNWYNGPTKSEYAPVSQVNPDEDDASSNNQDGSASSIGATIAENTDPKEISPLGDEAHNGSLAA